MGKVTYTKPLDLEDAPDNYRLVGNEIYLPPETARLLHGPGAFGSYRYEMEIEHPSGITKILSGIFCSVDCKNGLLDGELQNCVFSTQFDAHRGFDPMIPVEKTVDKSVFD